MFCAKCINDLIEKTKKMKVLYTSSKKKKKEIKFLSPRALILKTFFTVYEMCKTLARQSDENC